MISASVRCKLRAMTDAAAVGVTATRAHTHHTAISINTWQRLRFQNYWFLLRGIRMDVTMDSSSAYLDHTVDLARVIAQRALFAPRVEGRTRRGQRILPRDKDAQRELLKGAR